MKQSTALSLLATAITLIAVILVTGSLGDPKLDAQYDDAISGCFAKYGHDSQQTDSCLHYADFKFHKIDKWSDYGPAHKDMR